MRYSGFCKSAVQLLTPVYRRLGPLGQKCAMWLEQGRYDLILDHPMPDPNEREFPLNYAAWNLLRKSSTPDVGRDTCSNAISVWLECERECERTNLLGGVRPDMIDPLLKPVAEAVIHTAIRKIVDCLGPFSVDELFRQAEFSGGASTQRPRTRSAIQNKYVDNPYITPAAYRYWQTLRRASVVQLGTPILSNYSRFTTVPKNAKTDRPIIIEPQGNMFFQKGLGSMVRRRLKRKGINLNDQTRNQNLSGRGVEDRLATIDLSSASDLISYQTVCVLLQGVPDWLEAFCDLRVDTTRLNKKDLVHLQKFSGMGNGFTFELESLIFWALAEASAEVEAELGGCSCGKVVSIYGDDIIINSHHVDTLLVALSYCGFRVNTEKSYWTGPFRESCGKHFHNGVNISPITVTDQEFKRLEDLYWLYNSVSELFDRLDIPKRDVLSNIEKRIRELGGWVLVPPRFANTSGVRAPFDVACPRVKRRPRNRKTPWFGGWRVKFYTPKTRSRKVSQEGAYYYALRGLDSKRRLYDGSSIQLAYKQLEDEAIAKREGGIIDLTVVQQATDEYHFVVTEVAHWD